MVSSDKYWNTWDADNFAKMLDLESGLCIVPGAFSSMEKSYTEFLIQDHDSLRLMEHEKSGRYCRLTAEHATAEFEIEYLKPEPEVVMMRFRNTNIPVEWGLRYNILITLGYMFDEGEMEIVENNADRSLKGLTGDFHAAVRFTESPYEIVYASESDAVGRSMEGQGFKGTGERDAESRRWATCRFTLEQATEFCMVVAEAHSDKRAAARAEKWAGRFECWDKLKAEAMKDVPDDKGTEYPGMLRAVSEIMSWNHMHNHQLGREYTCIAKKWNAEFGKWYVFFSDTCYQMMMNAASGDFEMAAEDLDLALSLMTADGNFAGLLCGYQRWVDRAQPPVFAFSLWTYYAYTGDLAGVQRAYGSLRSAQKWYLAERSVNHDGLISLGTSMAGKGDYRGMKLAAKNETAMDNSPMYETAKYDKDKFILEIYDVGITSLELLDIECTAKLAELLGKTDEAEELTALYEAGKAKAKEVLWNDEDGIFANRMFDGSFGLTSPTSFYALAAGLANEDQLDRCIKHMFDPEEFFTECPLIAINAKDPSSKENRYWRGRTWAPQTYWAYIGLRRYGREKEAHHLALGALKYFNKHWTGERRAWENYNPYTGEGCDTPTSQPFYSWTALLPFLWSCEQFGVDPWSGMWFGCEDGQAFDQNNRLIRGAVYEAVSDGAVTELFRNKQAIFRSDIRARFRQFVWETHYAAVEVDAPSAGYVEFVRNDAFTACVDGNVIDVPEGTVRVDLCEGHHKVEIWA